VKSLGGLGCVASGLTAVYVCYEGFERELECGGRGGEGEGRLDEERKRRERKGGRGRTKRTSA